MRASTYAQAFHELAATEKIEGEKLVKQFVATVLGNGHAHLLPKIVRVLDRIEKRTEDQATIEVTSATALSPEKVAQLLKREPFKHALSAAHKKVVRKVDATLIGGAVVRTGAQKIDASYKSSLITLYQSLISQ
jgi:F-type H+-transporting ATPase subunit delta